MLVIIHLGGIMYKRKDFIWMDVYNLKGKKIGVITDLLINMSENVVKGFVISGISILKRSSTVLVEDIVSFNEYMIIEKLNKNYCYLSFDNLRGLEVVDDSGNIDGIIEEIIFDSSNFKIKGLIISRGILQNFTQGKKVILQQDYIIGDKNVFHVNKNKKFNFVTIFHKLNLEDGENEK